VSLPDGFVALADLLRDGRGSAGASPDHRERPTPTTQQARETQTAVETTETQAACAPAEAPSCTPAPDLADAMRDARLFRARLADALDAAAARLSRELATDVLARELRLAPADVGAIARRLVERAAPVVRLRVSPEDAGCAAPYPVVADARLAPGDAIVELDGGELDARLGVRLAGVLERLA